MIRDPSISDKIDPISFICNPSIRFNTSIPTIENVPQCTGNRKTSNISINSVPVEENLSPKRGGVFVNPPG